MAKKIFKYVKPDYPELRERVVTIVKQTIESINRSANEVQKSEMPYKAQWILENVIEELQSRV